MTDDKRIQERVLQYKREMSDLIEAEMDKYGENQLPPPTYPDHVKHVVEDYILEELAAVSLRTIQIIGILKKKKIVE